MKNPTFFTTIMDILKRKGIIFFIRKVAVVLFTYPYYKIFKSSRQFEFDGKEYQYFCSIYNTTWMNERAVEVPIIEEVVRNSKDKSILEVGNVLSHYFPMNHDVLDKYENIPGVINQDIIDFSPNKKYDLIVSISTLEHVGWDETLREPDKILRALNNLNKTLANGGMMIFTTPIGFNSNFDTLLKEGKLNLTRAYYLRRTSRDNIWEETDFENAMNTNYGKPYSFANAILIGVIKK